MVQIVAPRKKGKAPPKFQHFPEKRAKALKKAWVEKTKIKSKWKAEKKKLGLGGSTNPNPNLIPVGISAHHAFARTEGQGQEVRPQEDGVVEDPNVVEERGVKSKQSHKSLELRELSKAAYSQSSLHTYKSGGRGRDPGSKRGRGRGESRGQGRGQPNMKLRMNAMLESIKLNMGQ